MRNRKYLLVDVNYQSNGGGQNVVWKLFEQPGQQKANCVTSRYMAGGPKRFKGETRIMEYEEYKESDG